ncbi:hypothetical protein [Ruegeria sp.]|uniref:hypothetical protein n=1 Tax=Ruegeria sp. TaxID=1879320 RepID=UPI003B5A897A
MNEIVQLPIHLQIALAGGYMGYITAYSGLRAGHTARDAILLTLAFGVIPALAWPMLSTAFGRTGGLLQIGAAALALLLPILAGALWRRHGRTWWYDLLHRLKIHVDDGLCTGWEALIQQRDMEVTQIMVRTTDGTELFCRDAPAHTRAKGAFDAIGSFSPLLGTEGSVVMVVDEEAAPNGGDTERTAPVDDEWGARLTYIPADRIALVEMRVRDRR